MKLKNVEYPKSDKIIFVKNYLEAVGVIKAMEQGISLESIKRPIPYTKTTTE